MTLKELDKLSRADKLLKVCQQNMSAALREWAPRFSRRRIDQEPWISLMVVLLSAIEQACSFELTPWSEYAQAWPRDEFVSDIKRLVVPRVMAELTNLVQDLEEDRNIGPEEAYGPEKSFLLDIRREAASLIEERAAAAFDQAMFRAANPGPEYRFGSPVDDYLIFEDLPSLQEAIEVETREETEADEAGLAQIAKIETASTPSIAIGSAQPSEFLAPTRPVGDSAVRPLRSKRGRPANPERHFSIAAIVTPYEDKWKDSLDEISGKLDAADVEPRKTGNWKETWGATLAVNRDVVKKAIQDSLNSAKNTV